MPLLAGSSLISHCGPHFHDTYTIACMRSGRAEVRARGRSSIWGEGSVFLGNPYEIHAGGDQRERLVYDVCYPGRALMLEMLGIHASCELWPQFEDVVLPAGDVARELGAIVSNFLAPAADASAATCEQALLDFFRTHRDRFRIGFIGADASIWVSSACALLEKAVEDGADPVPLLAEIGCSQSYLIRQFRKVTGLTPGAYLRQLRLARARRLLCNGTSIADIAAEIGFADQPHLTREFKRVHGTTPGKLLRDVAQHPPRPDAPRKSENGGRLPAPA